MVWCMSAVRFGTFMECIFLAIVLKHNCWTKLMFVMKMRFEVGSSHFPASRGRSLPFPVEWILTIYAQWMAQCSPHIMFSLKWKLDSPNQVKTPLWHLDCFSVPFPYLDSIGETLEIEELSDFYKDERFELTLRSLTHCYIALTKCS